MSDETPAHHMSLEDVEGDAWGPPPADATRLVAAVHQVRRKPLADLEPEDLRLLLGQQVGVEILLPRVLRLLEAGFCLTDQLRTARRALPGEVGQLSSGRRGVCSLHHVPCRGAGISHQSNGVHMVVFTRVML